MTGPDELSSASGVKTADRLCRESNFPPSAMISPGVNHDMSEDSLTGIQWNFRSFDDRF